MSWSLAPFLPPPIPFTLIMSPSPSPIASSTLVWLSNQLHETIFLFIIPTFCLQLMFLLEQSSILGSMLDITIFLHHYAEHFIWQWFIVTSLMVLMLPLIFPKTLWKLHQMFKNISFEPSYMSTKILLLLPCSQKQVLCLLPLVVFFLPYTCWVYTSIARV